MIDANTYVTHKMGAGTQHMLGRIWARREIVALYEELSLIDATFRNPDSNYRAAKRSYNESAQLALQWKHLDAYNKAREGLGHIANYYRSHGAPVRVHADWDSPVHVPSPGVGLPQAECLKLILRIGEGQFAGSPNQVARE